MATAARRAAPGGGVAWYDQLLLQISLEHFPKTDLRLLVIAYVFPPASGIGGQRIVNFCRYLPEYGIEPVVLTVRERYHGRHDPSLVLPPGLRIERTSQRPTLLSLYGALKAGLTRAASRPRPGAEASAIADGGSAGALPLRQKVVLALQTPDLIRGWHAPAAHAGRRLLRSGGFHAVLSSGPPWTPHGVARSLARRFHLPWLADFRDPWAARDATGLPHWKQSLDRRMERAWLRDASLIICNTEALRANFAARYADFAPGRFVTITNGFPAPVPAGAAQNSGPRRIALHLGSLYHQRRIDGFCQAVESLLDRGELDPGSTQLLFVGDIDTEIREVAARCAPRALASGLLELRPPVMKSETGTLLREASLLLLFQGPYRLQLPAKFFEYLQTGKPMFAVAESGALTGMLEETGSGLWADPGDPAGIAAVLLRALREPPRLGMEEKWARRFDYRLLTGQLAEHVRALAANAAGPGASGKRTAASG